MKIHQIPDSLCHIWNHKSVFFKLCIKKAHQSANFKTFDWSGEISPNLYFDRLLLLKVYKISAKQVQRSYVSWYWKIDAKFEEKPICCFKNDKNLVNYDPSTQFSKICTVICPSCAKYITFDQKKYRGVIVNDTEESCKIWRKTDLWFGKWHEEFGRFSSEHLKMSKLVLSWGPFVKNRKCTS